MVATRNLDGKQEKAESRGEWGGGSILRMSVQTRMPVSIRKKQC